MPGAWLWTVLAAALPAAAVAVIILTICLLYHLHRGAKRRKQGGGQRGNVSLWPSIIVIHNDHSRGGEGSTSKRLKASNYKDSLDSSKIASAWRNTYPIKDFIWTDNPSLVSEAVEHGWLTYSFTFASHLGDSSRILPLKLWEACTAHMLPNPHESIFTAGEPEIVWEVCGASSDYMQKIRLNPGLRLINKEDHYPVMSRVQSLQSTLPLPGPPLGPLSFPQEGYYEVTIFPGIDDSFGEFSHSSFNESEHAKLIAPYSSTTIHRVSSARSYVASNALLNVPSDQIVQSDQIVHKRPSSLSALKGTPKPNENGIAHDQDLSEKEGCTHAKQVDVPALQSAVNEQLICAIGLAAGCAPPFRLPGSDVGSVGFFSNGRVFVNGIEQKKPMNWQQRIWGPTTAGSALTTVGCGFDPTARRLFFTLNGEMVEEIPLPPISGGGGGHGKMGPGEMSTDESNKSMEFTAHPLFPTIGANYGVTVTTNFGQAAFEYAEANAQRVPDPCFRRSPASKGGGAAEESTDLFSMGRLDSQWLADLGGARIPKSPPRLASGSDAAHVGDSELFEIALLGPEVDPLRCPSPSPNDLDPNKTRN